MKIMGQRLALRDWIEEDLSAYEKWLQPENLWHEYDGPYYSKPTPKDIEEIINRLRDQISKGDFPDPRRNLVIADLDTDRLIGRVSRYWQSQETLWLCVGISIYDPGDWNRGFGFEALGLWCDHLFAQPMELHRLDLRTWSGNVGMIRLAEKLGFQLEARFRDARIVDGEYYDGLGFGILRPEWEAQYPDGFSAFLQRR